MLAQPLPARLAAGLNASLRLYDTHKRELDALPARPKVAAVWTCVESGRDAILRGLDNPDLDAVYLFCHARDGFTEPTIKRPFLDFGDEVAGKPGQILSKELEEGAAWSHRPLVFLNGCGTAGFSPDALSPFIRVLMRDRQAGGVVGTEIPVSEELASGFAMLFLERFLAGESAGEALLGARRALLAQENPLGLVYTFYGLCELRLDA